MDEWISKMWYVHTMEYYSAFKKKEILVYAIIWINLEDIMLGKINKTVTKRQILYNSTYMKYLKQSNHKDKKY